jgi:hypothetical protein
MKPVFAIIVLIAIYTGVSNQDYVEERKAEMQRIYDACMENPKAKAYICDQKIRRQFSDIIEEEYRLPVTLTEPIRR